MERNEWSVFAVAALGVAAACGGNETGRHQFIDHAGAGGAGNGGAPSAGGAGAEAGSGGASSTGGSGLGGGAPSSGGAATTGGATGAGGEPSPRGECQNACPPVTLATNQSFPGAIAIDRNQVYWSVDVGGPDGAILRVPFAGGAPIPVASAQDGVRAIAVDATSIYWNTSSAIRSAPIDGGEAIDLSPTTDVTEGIAVDATHVYWTSNGTDGGVWKAPVGGGEPVPLATVPGGGSTAIALDATHVYWINAYAGTPNAVMKVPKAGGEPVPLAPGGQFSSVGIAVDSEGVYWTAFGLVPDEDAILRYGGFLVRVSLDGGSPWTVATSTNMPRALSMNDLGLFWGTASTFTATGFGSTTDGALLNTTPLGASSTVIPGIEPAAIAARGADVCWTIHERSGTVACLGWCDGAECHPAD